MSNNFQTCNIFTNLLQNFLSSDCRWKLSLNYQISLVLIHVTYNNYTRILNFSRVIERSLASFKKNSQVTKLRLTSKWLPAEIVRDML